MLSAESDQGKTVKPRGRRSLHFANPLSANVSEVEGSSSKLDHDYATFSTTSSIYDEHHLRKLVQKCDADCVTLQDADYLSSTIENARVKLCKGDTVGMRELASQLLDCPSLSSAVRCMLLLQLDNELDRLSSTKERSILRSTSETFSKDTVMRQVLGEMNDRCPMALDILITLCTPIHRSLSDTNYLVVTSMRC